MMVRFSCFNAHIHCHKPKKTFQPSVEAMQHNLEDSSQIQAPSGSPESKSLSPSFLKPGDSHSDDTSKPASFTSVDRGWKSEEIKGKFNFEVGAVAHQTRCIKKSQSLGSELFLKERAPDENNVYDGTDQGFSSDSCEQNDWVVLDSGKDSRGIARYQKAPHSESVQVSSDRVNNGSIFSVGDPPHSEKESCQYSDSPLSGDRVDDSGNSTSHTPPGIVKSSSSPNIVGSVPTSGGLSPLKYLTPQSRCSDDIHALDIWRKENQVPVYVGVRQEHGRDGNIHKSEKDNLENFVDDGFDSYNYSALAKDWIVPVTDEVILENFYQGDSSVQHGDDLPSKDYKIKRIEDWVNDLQHCSALVEANELLDCSDQSKRESSVLNDLNAAKVEVKVTPGMEAAKKYISSLSALASAAQLANHGLVVIPFLSAFSSLRVLNLSGNAIVRITAGALPRGLHMLNLSKNNISTIEGLRELTRLRVLDLSYNRIFRIGHGLASCSSLKELYLAGNKISEVEGLHRLLKLTVLDLRFNKISTTKCLGQLAANYNSLQAISLEGNPAQKNVGDEQLKKYLQGLLPHLTYFNRQQIRASSLKDAADRSVRLGISGHQFDRGLRSELKGTRRSSHGVAAHRPSSSATHGRKSQIVVSPKRSKGRHGRLPPTGIKAMPDNQHYFDFSSKLISFRSKLSIPRSRSEGTLGVL